VERPRKIIVGLALAFALTANVGCQSLSTSSMKRTIENAQERIGLRQEPVSELICYWQRRPAFLQNPTKDGEQVMGLVGQVFMLSPNQKTATAQGDLTIALYDTTPRGPNSPEATPAIFHFDAATLARMRTNDERLGPCYAIFMPWPEAWKDVTSVRAQARYDAVDKSSPTVNSQAVSMNLDFVGDSMPKIEHASYRTVAGVVPDAKRAQSDLRGVPSPERLLRGEAIPSNKPPEPGQPFVRSNMPLLNMTPTPNTPAPQDYRATPTSVPNRVMAPQQPSQNEPIVTRNGDSTVTTQTWKSPPPNRLPFHFDPNLPPPPGGGIEPLKLTR
jgi:hypothetical protein